MPASMCIFPGFDSLDLQACLCYLVLGFSACRYCLERKKNENHVKGDSVGNHCINIHVQSRKLP